MVGLWRGGARVQAKGAAPRSPRRDGFRVRGWEHHPHSALGYRIPATVRGHLVAAATELPQQAGLS